MSNYRRLISYMYAYEGQVKGKNIGFAKLEVRNGQCKIQVSVKKVYESGNDVGVYLLADEMEILIGKIYIRNGNGEFRTSVRADNVESSGFSMAQIYGLTIHDIKNPWVSYTTIWEDAVTQAAQIDLEHVTSEKYQSEELQEEREMRIVQQIEEEVEKQEREKEIAQREEKGREEPLRYTMKRENDFNFKKENFQKEDFQKKDFDQNMQFTQELQNGVLWNKNLDRSTADAAESAVYDETDNETKKEMKDETERDIEHEKMNEMQNEIENEVRSEMKNEMRNEIKIKRNLPNTYIPASNSRSGEEEAESVSAQKKETIQLYNAGYEFRKENTGRTERMYRAGTGYDIRIQAEDERDRYAIQTQGSRNEVLGRKRWECEPQLIRQRMAESDDWDQRDKVSENMEGAGEYQASYVSEFTYRNIGQNTEWNQKERKSADAGWSAAEQNSSGKDTRHSSWFPLSFSGAKQTNEKEQAGEQSTAAGSGNKESRLSGWTAGIFNRKKAEEAKSSEEKKMQPSSGLDLARQVTFRLFEEKPTEKVDALQSDEIWKSENRMEVEEETERGRWEEVPYIEGRKPGPDDVLEPVTEKIFSSKMLSQKAAQFMAQNQEKQAVPENRIQIESTVKEVKNKSQLLENEVSKNNENEERKIQNKMDSSRVDFKQDAEKLREFEQEEKANPEDSEKLWESLRSLYPKLQEFDYETGCEILAIKPKDIGLLPRENWVYGNNSFLLHGYYNYRYLILVQLTETEGKRRYLLGVPGHYYNNDRYMASMFGFPGFVLSKKQPTEDGRFGYWYTNITMQAEE
ncbi:MAG: DUF6128 domain-containing protein [bacterium]|nr:DUF6128 domain-containing protein [bacterium]